MIPPVSGGSDAAARILEIRTDAFGTAILAELVSGSPPRRTARSSASSASAAVRDARAGAGGRGRPARRPPGRVADVRDPRVDGPGRDGRDRGRDRDALRRHLARIVHRDGEVPLGEPSVAIVACAPHRDAALFEAARYAIDETKARAPIWKAEQFSDGHVWIGDPARSGPPKAEAGPCSELSSAMFRFDEVDAALDPVLNLVEAVSRCVGESAGRSFARCARKRRWRSLPGGVGECDGSVGGLAGRVSR